MDALLHAWGVALHNPALLILQTALAPKFSISGPHTDIATLKRLVSPFGQQASSLTPC